MKKFINKKLSVFLLLLTALTALLVFAYLYVIPRVVCHPKTIAFIQKAVADNCNAELIITNPVLETSLNTHIGFRTPSVTLTKEGESLLNLQNFNIEINLTKIFRKKIVLEKLGAEEIYADINKIQNLRIKENKNEEKKAAPFSFDCFRTLFYIKKCALLYETANGVRTKLLAKDLEVSDGNEPKYLHFKIFLDLFHKDKHLRLFFKDENNVYFKDRKLQANDFRLRVNKSDIFLNAFMDEQHHYKINVKSDKFDIENINRLLNTNLVIPYGTDITGCFGNFDGDFKFNITLSDEDINGLLNVNKISADLIPAANLPLTITDGTISFNSKDIFLNDFEGFYDKNSKNKLKMFGKVDDYNKKADTKITIKGIAYDDLGKYLSKLAGVKISLVRDALVNMDILYNSSGKVDVKGKVGFDSGSDILFEGASISPVKYYREVKIDLSLVKEILTMNHIDYFIEDTTMNKPIVQIKGALNAFTGYLRELEFDVPEPIPSEFFNVLAGQNILRRGTFSGKMKFRNAKNPYLEGKMELLDTIVSGQFVIIKNMTIEAKNTIVKIISEGLIRRAKYSVNADIVNNIVFPIIVKNVNVSFDEIDAEKIMQTFAPRPKTPDGTKRPQNSQIKFAESNISTKYFVVENENKDTQKETEQIAFQPNLIEIRNCLFNVKKGKYKSIDFGNLNAVLTLTRNGIAQIKSNKFDFAKGTSSLDVNCDLLNEKYSIVLDAKEVDTDAIATSVLNLGKEITGKANAKLEFNTDSSMKLNGKIDFEVLDGSIAKLGLIQYVLNVAAVFRNPLAMISPSTLVDLVNLPDGTFDRINGKLRIQNNIIDRMFIKSSSKQISALITGSLNLENMDSSIRIYTKFNNKHKGFLGFLRGLSLNSLAQKTSKHTKANRESFYEAELSLLPPLETGEDTAQVFLTQIDGDVQTTNFLSSLKKIK